MKIFLISPVRGIDETTKKRIQDYVGRLEAQSHDVYWPLRDTKQDDPTGGREICRKNLQEIANRPEIHVWYVETSGGSKFDMGGLFMLLEILGWHKKVVIANEEEVEDAPGKSFYKVLQRLAAKTNS